MKRYGIELSELLNISTSHGFGIECVEFMEYLVDQTVQVHCKDNLIEHNAEVIHGSHNPEKGIAYYFTSHGNQIRKQPQYKIDQVNLNYDKIPTVDEICKNKFPRVSYGGFGYMFLWFCPIHDHCYGFHLIHGGEGRKDTFSSLYKFLSEALKEVFYDFACQFNEYYLN